MVRILFLNVKLWTEIDYPQFKMTDTNFYQNFPNKTIASILCGPHNFFAQSKNAEMIRALLFGQTVKGGWNVFVPNFTLPTLNFYLWPVKNKIIQISWFFVYLLFLNNKIKNFGILFSFFFWYGCWADGWGGKWNLIGCCCYIVLFILDRRIN